MRLQRTVAVASAFLGFVVTEGAWASPRVHPHTNAPFLRPPAVTGDDGTTMDNTNAAATIDSSSITANSFWSKARLPTLLVRRNKKSSSTARYSSASAALSVADEDAVPDSDNEKTAGSSSSSVSAATFGLVKAMVGSGVLALPAGVAAASNYPGSLVPANILMAIMGLLSAYTFLLYGRLTDQTQATSLGDLWKKVQKTDSSFLMSLSSLVYCFGTALTFSLVIGDSVASLAVAGGLTGWMAARQTAILAVTAGIIYPLCNLQSLAALAPMSVIGVLGTLVSTLFLAFRCPAVVASSPYAVGGAMLKTIPAAMQPQFQTYSRFNTPAPLILLAMGCTSLMAHFSTPDFYHSLADNKNAGAATKEVDSDATTESVTARGNPAALKKYTKMTVTAFIAVILINAMTMSFGFLTFGGNSAGIVLNNYSAADVGASISRLLVAISVIGSYPFVLSACRAAALEIFANGKKVTRRLEKKTTSILVTLLTGMCMILKDAGFVVSFNGALVGTALIYIFPCLLFLKQTGPDGSSRIDTSSRSVRLERAFCHFLVGFGALASVIGAGTSVLNSYFPHMLG